MRIEELQSYELLEKRRIEDVNAEGYVLRHKKTGAKVALLSNDDENKVFCIGFRTPPQDSTGLPHILEHSVLCGSRQFPIKDPFVELVKGSLNTFLNAMTFPDKTLYPVASCNAADFQNLIHVYLDAVFYPNIYTQENIFRQEGWHYEMEDADSDLTINGVVYNEMKGVFSSPDEVLNRELMNSLFPDTAYGYESGGDPLDIPNLTYEQFLDFHRQYYHPSNSYIYLYGDMDMAEKLDFIDKNYLSAFERAEVCSKLRLQEPFSALNRVEKEYPVNEEETEEKNTNLAYSMVVGDALDKELYVAFQILDYALCSAPGAPLKQALVDKGIGTDVYSIYDNSVRQPYFSVIAKNTDADKEEAFVSTIQDVLGGIVKNGMDKKALLAGINYYEFRYREADFGSYPKGLMYGMQMYDSWLYDDGKPFLHIEANATFARMKQLAQEGGFERLIQKYLLDNPHKSIIVLKPKKGLTAERDRQQKEMLAAKKAAMNQAQTERIIADTKALEAWQETPDVKEDLEKIPLLSRADMKKEAVRLVNECREADGTKILCHPMFTNGIAYLRLIFTADRVPAELFPYIGILKGTLGLLDTENFAYGDLFNEINIATGGIAAVNNVYGNIRDTSACTATMEMKVKVLYPNLEKAVDLLREIMLTSKFEDKKRIGEILAEGKSRMQGQMISAGHSVAVNRMLSYVTGTGEMNELLSGVDFYRLVETLLEDYDAQAEELGRKLRTLSEILFRSENLMVDFVGDEEGYAPLPGLIGKLKKELYTCAVPEGTYVPVTVKKNEGFKTAGQVQYVCRGGNFKKQGLEYHGSLKVLKVMLGYDYLWSQIRVKGGAYGCMCNFTKSGDSYFVSYRDPNLDKTVEVYEKTAEYIEGFEADERMLTQYIIGAISELDTPMNPAAKGLFSLSAYMMGITQEDLQRERDELLSTDTHMLRETARFIRAVMEENCLCVVGNGQTIEASKEKFGKVENLFK